MYKRQSWDDVAVIAVVVITVSACVFAISKPLSAFQLGEAYAKSVGVNVARFRMVLVLLASMLSACVTAFAGPVSFVGIAVPHLVKSALKSSKPIRVIPACFLGGDVYKRQVLGSFLRFGFDRRLSAVASHYVYCAYHFGCAPAGT